MLVFVVVGLAFLAGAMLALGLAAPSAHRENLNRRLEGIARPAGSLAPALAEARLEGSLWERLGQPALRRLAQLAARVTPQGAMETLRASLIRAGSPAGLSIAEFSGLRVLSGLVFLGLAALAARFLGHTPLVKLAAFGFSLLIGLTLPDALLAQRIAERQRRILSRLPDVLDLLVVSLEAGLGFDGALLRVTEKSRGPLCEELERALNEMRLGKSRGQALRDMAERVDLPEMKSLAAALYQSDQLGASLVQVLRAQSEALRVTRTQRIREAAAKLPVTMLFPLVFFVFPAVFVILVGPAFIRIFQAFAHL